MAARLPQHLIALALVALAGCGGSEAAPDRPVSTRLVDPKGATPLVTTLAAVPGSDDLLLGTNKGLWRIRPDGGLTRQTARLSYSGLSDTVTRSLDAAYTGAQTLVASGHPDTGNGLPANLGVIGSGDGGRTWNSVAELGAADLHALAVVDGRLYGWDAIRGELLVSADGGRTSKRLTTPQETIVDLTVDPDDPRPILLAGTSQLYRSTDGGRSWRPIAPGESRVAFIGADVVLRADADGTILHGSGDGTGWERIGSVEGAAPYRLEATADPDVAALALADGSVLVTADGGRTWKPRLRA